MTADSGFAGKFLNWLCFSLSQEDRDALIGDLNEESAGLLASVLSISGFLLRRELAQWGSPLPWAALFLLAGGMLALKLVAMDFADGTAISTWMLANNTDMDLMKQAGFWFGVRQWLPQLAGGALALAGWSWCCGYTVGRICRQTRLSIAVLAVLLAGLALCGVVPFPGYAVVSAHARAFPWNAAVFRNAFYRDLYPRLILVALVLLPILRGHHDAMHAPAAGDRALPWLRGMALVSLLARIFIPGPYSPAFAWVCIACVITHFLLLQFPPVSEGEHCLD